MTLKPYGEHMVSCPKCRYSKIHGPYYFPSSKVQVGNAFIGGPECMEWRCGKCGYVEKTATMDSHKTESNP